MTPKETQRSSRKAQQFHRSSKPGMGERPALAPRDWLASVAGQKVDDDDFSGDDLVSAHLSETRFSRCLFVSADLRQADLTRSHFRYCDLSAADLTGADLAAATFWHCDFSGAKLGFVDLAAATFDHCAGLPLEP